jgi:MFS family permease
VESPDPKTVRRNIRYGVLNGMLFTFGEALNNGSLVLGLLIRQLGGSLGMVGLIPALQSGGWLLPQMLVGGRLQALPYKLPLYHRSAMVRIVAYSLMTLCIFGANWLPSSVVVAAILLCYTVYNVGGGTSALAFQDVVAKVVPLQQRGRFFGRRQLFGGLLAFAIAGPLASWMMSDAAPLPFPYNYGVLSLASLIVVATGLLIFSLVKEPPQTKVGPMVGFWASLRKAPTILRANKPYRTFIAARLLLRAGQIGEPFYIIYATEVLHVSVGMAGAYVGVRAISGALSNIYWGRVSDRQGNKRLMFLTGILIVATPFIALIGPWLVGLIGLSTTWVGLMMAVVYMLVGLSLDGSNIAGLTYLMEIVPENERPSYIGLANTLLGVVTLLPVIGGQIVHYLGYYGLFIIGFLFALVGLFMVLQLPERQRNSSPAA